MTRVSFEGGMKFVGRGDSGHPVVMDSSPRVGGADSAARPVEVFLCSLGGCTGMDVVSILRKMKSEPEAFHIEIETEREADYPKVFKAIHLSYIVKGNVPEENLKKAIDLSLKKYCPIANTLAGVTEITSSYRIEPSS